MGLLGVRPGRSSAQLYNNLDINTESVTVQLILSLPISGSLLGGRYDKAFTVGEVGAGELLAVASR
jgi:hypothetical protein